MNDKQQTLENNEWLSKILNSSQRHFFADTEPLSFHFAFGDDFIPNDVTIAGLAKEINRGDLIWIPLNLAWSGALGHYKYRNRIC